jgi:hypothetical protein
MESRLHSPWQRWGEQGKHESQSLRGLPLPFELESRSIDYLGSREWRSVLSDDACATFGFYVRVVSARAVMRELS